MIMEPLSDMVGPERAELLTDWWVRQTMEWDGLTAEPARRVVEGRVSLGDPLLLAATGQIWVLTDPSMLDTVPAMILRIVGLVGPDHGRPDHRDGPEMFYASLDPGADPRLAVAPVAMLRTYQLQSWNTPSVSDGTPGGAA